MRIELEQDSVKLGSLTLTCGLWHSYLCKNKNKKKVLLVAGDDGTMNTSDFEHDGVYRLVKIYSPDCDDYCSKQDIIIVKQGSLFVAAYGYGAANKDVPAEKLQLTPVIAFYSNNVATDITAAYELRRKFKLEDLKLYLGDEE